VSANTGPSSSRSRIGRLPFGNAARATAAVCSGTSGHGIGRIDIASAPTPPRPSQHRHTASRKPTTSHKSPHRINQLDPSGPDTEKAETVEKVCAYLKIKSPYLEYGTALKRGRPIAYGIIEGACRHLIKDRLDITGARWSLPGAEAVLKLRALISNGDFEPYFAWHRQREHQRNHQARHRDKLGVSRPVTQRELHPTRFARVGDGRP